MGQVIQRIVSLTRLSVLKIPLIQQYSKKKNSQRTTESVYIGSAEEDFRRFLPYKGIAAMLDIQHALLNQFLFPQPQEVLLEIW